MRPLTRSILACGLSSALATSALAAPARGVDIEAGPLGDALAEFARETGVELLFTEPQVRGKRVKALKGRLTPAQALSTLLAGSGLGYRAAKDGSFVLVALPPEPIADPGDGAVAEILVVGRRTQNADIRRTENDIQPYSILGPRALDVVQTDNLDQLLRARTPANAQVVARSQFVPGGPAANSAIDLRGVGTQRTLVLIDGRRVPSLPTADAGLDQADLNALPLGAIERIETLTGTAGGIHGFSAIGGAVNVVLKRDYQGADLTVASGLSARGDAGRVRIEARLGFTPDDRTDVMLAASHAEAEPLYVGDRDFRRRATILAGKNDPDAFVERRSPANGVIVQSSSGRPLRLDPALGGAALDSFHSFLPVDFSGDAAAMAEMLVANSGRLPEGAPPGRAGARTSLVSTPETRSALLNVRRRLSDRLEVFVDGLYLDNRGRTSTPELDIDGYVPADAPTNPFTEAVYFTVPAEGLYSDNAAKIETQRVTGGVIATLPRDWRASFDYAVGRTILTTRTSSLQPTQAFDQIFSSGLRSQDGRPAIAPLDPYAALQSALLAYTYRSVTTQKLTTEFRNAAFRAAGPLLDLPGGPLTLTLLGDIRRERIPEGESYTQAESRAFTTRAAARGQEVRSAYLELRAPLATQDAAIPLARGLEVQLAVRRDNIRSTFPENVNFAADAPQITTRHQADVFTAGARVFPTPWLMLRGSVATGETPPDLKRLPQLSFLVAFDRPGEYTDPKRAGRRITQDGAYLWVRSGYQGLDPEKGHTASAGIVLNPSGREGPRLSIDYSRVELRDEVIDLGLSIGGIIAAEDTLPDRIVREPLSAADAARGYTAGRIVEVRTGVANAGRLVTETMDMQLDWTLPPTRFGEARLYGALTWQPTFRRRVHFRGVLFDVSNLQDAPLEWRGNAGVQWTRGDLTVDLNLQHYDGHSLDYSPASAVQTGLERIALQGSAYVPAQTYVDLAVRRRFALAPGGAAKALDVLFGVQNLFDRSPPVVADPDNMGYDYYGDPRRRRFELRLTATF